MTAEDGAGVARQILLADPDTVTTLRANTQLQLEVDGFAAALVALPGAEVNLFYNNVKAFGTSAFGQAAVYSRFDADNENRSLVFANNDDTVRARLGFESAIGDRLVLRNDIAGGEISIQQEIFGGGGQIEILNYDANGTVLTLRAGLTHQLVFDSGDIALRAQDNSFLTLHHKNTETARTRTTATGGLGVTNLLTGSGDERVATVPGDVRPTQWKVKTLNELISLSTTMQDDDHIFGFNLVADKYYAIEGMFICSGSPGDLDFLFEFTNARQAGRVSHVLSDDTIHTTAESFNQSIQLEHLVILGVGQQMVHLKGWFLTNATTGGTMKLRWAQNSSSGTATNMQSGTWVRITQLQD